LTIAWQSLEVLKYTLSLVPPVVVHAGRRANIAAAKTTRDFISTSQEEHSLSIVNPHGEIRLEHYA
jgi:hypothetical protein